MLNFIFRTIPLSLFSILRLLLFVVCLFPGFIRFAWYYFIAADRVSLRYGSESVRQTLDVYRSCRDNNVQRQGLLGRDGNDFSEECLSNAPVIVFCTGGAWMIGYKMWGALLARALTAAGIVVVIPDTRNYPFVKVPRMVEDVDAAIEWTFNNIAQYGGDPTNVVVVGQSAGGHLACMAIFKKVRSKISGDDTPASTIGAIVEDDDDWSVSDLRGFAAISSPLSLGSILSQSFQRQGFDDKMVNRMFGNPDKDEERKENDPLLILQSLRTEEKQTFLKELPPISIYHGTADKTVPFEISEIFYRELLRAKLDEQSVSFVSYDGWSHTDPILEGPMDADQRLHKDLFNDVNKWTTSPNLPWPNDPRVTERLCPHFLVRISRFLMPF